MIVIEITMNGYQAGKMNEIRNVIFCLDLWEGWKPSSSTLRLKLGYLPSWVFDKIQNFGENLA